LSVEHPHSKIITVAARELLAPIGLVRKGRSRTWLDDQGWWLGVVEFQSSSFSRGTYLNVGLNWLWSGKNYLSFNVGGRVHIKDGRRDVQYWEYESDDQFRQVAHTVVFEARNQVERLRAAFRDPSTAAKTLAIQPTPAQRLDRAVLLALEGDAPEARAEIGRFLEAISPLTGDVRHGWLDRADNLRDRLSDLAEFRKWIVDEIERTRTTLKLAWPIELPERFNR
jgi:hypothetical protein